ncbi:MAG: N-acetylmuramoyl-L-alanine amidase [Clostridiales Family XIII bacterium]|jgi:N-acetylmuramoyl-L-alanine amidase|nr:N-acetylmuramoyl-L-alanine amidase [Clostridiales Family XIII bacterium]
MKSQKQKAGKAFMTKTFAAYRGAFCAGLAAALIFTGGAGLLPAYADTPVPVPPIAEIEDPAPDDTSRLEGIDAVLPVLPAAADGLDGLGGADGAAVVSPAAVTESEILEGVAFCSEFPVNLFLDGEAVESDVPPVIIKERTLIPARALFERMGAIVSWNEETRQVGVAMPGTEILLTLDSYAYSVNGNEHTADVPPLIIADRTMIPVRVVAEALLCEVLWEDETRTVSVFLPLPEPVVPQEPLVPDDLAGETGETGGNATAGILSGQNAQTPSRDGGAGRGDAYGFLPTLNPALQGRLVVIDPGHGGMDPGALGEENGVTVLKEKDINLDVALRLDAYLRAAGLSTYLTRSGDETVELYSRPETANGTGAELYVSVHNNANPKPDTSGTETYYFSKEWEAGYLIDSKTLAESIQRTLCASLGSIDRGSKNEPAYVVLNRTQMPAVIIEGAFLSNASDRELMKTDAYRDAYAYGAAKGILEALNGAFPEQVLDNMMPVGL